MTSTLKVENTGTDPVSEVLYKFSYLSLLTEPLMLICGFFSLVVACIIYRRANFTISREVEDAVEKLYNIIVQCLLIHDTLEASVRELSRTGYVQACKAVRKSADRASKERCTELKPVLAILQSSRNAARILPKVEKLITKERDLREKIMLKQTTLVDYYEKKSGRRDIKNLLALIEQEISALKQEVHDLLASLEGIWLAKYVKMFCK